MSRVSPTLDGFRTALRRPSFAFAEIAWRWTIGSTACALWFFWLIEYLDTLPVTTGDRALLSTRQPWLVGRAIAHIFRGSVSRAVLAAGLAALALSLLWIIAASIGRAVTVRALLEHFRRTSESTNAAEATAKPRRLRGLIGHNFLRAALALAALLALVAAAVFVNFASTDADPRTALALILFLPLAGLIYLAWYGLNWLLSLAAIFAVRDGDDTLSAISAAVEFAREHAGAVAAVSTWTGLAHIAAWFFAFSSISFPLAFVHVLPWRLALAGVIAVMLVYFAVVDWLYMARLAGYVCIAEMPETLVETPPTPSLSGPLGQTTVDQDELILSDIPGSSLSPSVMPC